MPLEMTRSLARAAALDAGNRHMRQAGRKAWSKEDLDAAVEEFDRLWPDERDWEGTKDSRKRGNQNRQIELENNKQ